MQFARTMLHFGIFVTEFFYASKFWINLIRTLDASVYLIFFEFWIPISNKNFRDLVLFVQLCFNFE